MGESGPQRDFFGPPQVPVQVECIHCGQQYSSSQIRWEPISQSDPDHGFWCCPMPGCGGTGFLFDIWPTDPDYRDEDGNKVFYAGEDDDIDL